MIRDIARNEIEQALLITHTAFVGKVAAVDGVRVSVQPLTYAKEQGGPAYVQPLLTGLAMMEGLELAEGDVVMCAVCERDISRALRGEFAMPAARRHSLADSVVLGRVAREK